MIFRFSKFGGGYLLMPEPREIVMGGKMLIGYSDGRSDAFSECGHRPWQRGYKDEERFNREWEALQRLTAEWAEMPGPEYRGTSAHLRRVPLDGPYVKSDEFHQHDLERTLSVDGTVRLIFRASRPCSFGISRSRIAMSGTSCCAKATASRQVTTSPQTSQPGCSLSK
jgi:hypothetical protein